MGLFVAPSYASANMIDDIVANLFGGNASASSSNSTQQDINKNSQSMDLLKANVSSASIVSNKNDKDSVDLNKDVNIVADSALTPNVSPINPDGTDVDNGDPITDQVSVYVVRKGDSVADIAKMFNVTTNTILWANDLKKGSKLVEGDTLFILPVSGVNVTVSKGQTLKGLAKKYGVDIADIASFNGIAVDSDLTVGDQLIIPDGEIADSPTLTNTKQPTKTSTKTTKTPKKYSTKSVGQYFINPVPNYVRRSQGLHANNGIDLAAPTGTAVVAPASGTVLLARMGYNGGYGNMILINHPNGTQTLYGHLHKIEVHTGDTVNQGDEIGEVGSTGHSTGPHLHFEVHGAMNPGGTMPMTWAN